MSTDERQTECRPEIAETVGQMYASCIEAAGAAMNVRIASGLSLIGDTMPKDSTRTFARVPYVVAVAAVGSLRLAGRVTYEMASRISSTIGMNCSKAGS